MFLKFAGPDGLDKTRSLAEPKFVGSGCETFISLCLSTGVDKTASEGASKGH